MSFVFGGVELGFLLSPFLAGVVYKRAGYTAVFAMIFGVLGFDLILRAFIVEEDEANQRWEKDNKYILHYPFVEEESEFSETDSDSADSSEEPMCNENDTEEEQQTPPTSADEMSPLISRDPEEPRSWVSHQLAQMAVLLSSRRLIAAFYGSFTHVFLSSTFDAILAQYVKRTFGWNSVGAGSSFLLLRGPCILGPLFGRLSDRHGSRVVTLTGFAVAILGFVLLGQVDNDSTTDQVFLCVFLLVIG